MYEMGIFNEFEMNFKIFQFTLSSWIPTNKNDDSINQKINSNTFIIENERFDCYDKRK